MTIKDAKDFFSKKIIQSASRENIAFDSLENQMLYWSSEHEDMGLQRKFEEKHNDADYEKKVKDLLLKAYSYDRENDPEAIEKYKNAYESLRLGDHYLLVLLDGSIGSKLSTFNGQVLFTEFKKIEFKDVLLFFQAFLGVAELDPKDKIGAFFRFFTGALSLALFYLPIMALFRDGFRDFDRGAPNSDDLKMLFSLAIVFGFISIRGRFSTAKLFLTRWMK